MRDRSGNSRAPIRSFGFLLVSICLAVGLPPAISSAQNPETEDPTKGRETVTPDEKEGFPYDIVIEGEMDGGLRELLEKSSLLVSLEDKPPASEAALLRRLREDRERLRRVLRSEGYYSGEIAESIDRSEIPTRISLKVDPGTPFHLGQFEIVYTGEHLRDPAPPEIRYSELGLTPRMRARAPAIQEAEAAMLRILSENARPLARILDRNTVIDHATNLMTVELRVDPGPFSRFGDLTITGLEHVNPRYLRRIIRWPSNAPYDRRVLSDIRERMFKTRLFDSVRTVSADRADADGRIPVTIQFEEGTRRTIGLGGSYSTDEGFGAELFWTHRNLRGQGENLRLQFNGTEVRQSARAALRKPNFLAYDQTLVLSAELRYQDSDAYEEKTFQTFVGFERQFSDTWEGSIGLQPEYSRVNDNQSDWATYVGLGLPTFLRRDASDDLLDPTEGSRLSLTVTPNVGDYRKEVFFLTNEGQASAYFTPFESGLLTLAGRGRLGVTVGEDTDDIPPTKRFYAGGGGSIRGYEYQSVGPLDDSNDPLGGRSLLLLSAEARFRVTESIGFVPFLDGGTAYDTVVPDLSETMRWAAGLGFRYYTAAGPLRLDIAFPLNGREGEDEDFEFYVSVGQSF